MDKVENPTALRVKNSFSIENILSRPETKLQNQRRQETFYSNQVSVYENAMPIDRMKINESRDKSEKFQNSTDVIDNDDPESNSEIASDDGNSSVHTSTSDDRKKRPRTAFSAAQIKALESEFERGKYLSVAKRTSLAKTLNLTETQIKIWFQNRRTKFKRKYTSDVETLASHYYSSLGIGSITRPMVVGDRLWLFSQPPHGPPAPLQSVLLNNVPPAPQHISPMHPTALNRNYVVSSPVVQQRNHGFNISPSTSSLNLMNKQMRFDYFNKLQFSSYNQGPSEPVDFRFGNKPFLKTPETHFGELSNEQTSELASLESRFGNNSSILGENSKLQDAISLNDDAGSSSDSEIDCEQIEN